MKTKNSWFFTSMFWLFLLLIVLWGLGMAGTWALIVAMCCLILPVIGVIAYSVLIGFGALIGDDN